MLSENEHYFNLDDVCNRLTYYYVTAQHIKMFDKTRLHNSNLNNREDVDMVTQL